VGYYIRILGKNLTPPQLKDLQRAADPGVIEGEEGVGDEWEAFTLKHRAGDPIAFIERNPVAPGELGAEELQEFIDEVAHHKPPSAAAWLSEYLPGVKVIYAFQVLSGTKTDNGWALLHQVYAAVWNAAGGILQADGEGFSNEAGYTILWQFSDGVTGEWKVGIVMSGGQWLNFKMDLGSQAHREAFWRGELPVGAELIP
jgi:hypothetical protein